MRFPTGNKVHQDINEGFGENVALLEDKMKRVDWRWFATVYAAAFTMLLVSVFALIVVVKLALKII